MPKPRVFWYHYNAPASARAGRVQMSVHFADACHTVDGVDCRVPCRSHENRRQPRCVMKGWCRSVVVTDGVAVIE